MFHFEVSMRTWSLAILLASLLPWQAGCGAAPAQPGMTGAERWQSAAAAVPVVKALRDAAVPLKGSKPGLDHADLAAFGASTRLARVVGLGEATHGTREFFEIKHRLISYLVKESGFRVLAFEANPHFGAAIDHYLQTGEGDPERLVGTDFEIWRSRELVELLVWLRAHNASVPADKRVRFEAFDMQSVVLPLRRLQQRLAEVDASAAELIAQSAAPLHDSARYDAMTSAERQALRERVAQIGRLVDRNREALIQETSELAFRRLRQDARLLSQRERALAAQGSPDEAGWRDEAMAANVSWLTEELYPGQKVALWAHNGHVAIDTGIPEMPKAMGHHLKARFGAGYHAVGLNFSRGEVRARRIKGDGSFGESEVFRLPDAPADSLDGQCRATGLRHFFLDIKQASRRGPLSGWLGQHQTSRLLGWGYAPEWSEMLLVPQRLSTTYDSLVFIDESHGSELLPQMR